MSYDMLVCCVILLHLHARRGRAGLADGQPSAEMRRMAVTLHSIQDMLSGVLLLLYLQARCVRACLDDERSSAEMRRLWSYGSHFAPCT
jgi:hypothetical protein